MENTNNKLQLLKRRGVELDLSFITLCRSSYRGGPEYIKEDNLYTHSRESVLEFICRKKRSYYYNFTAPVVDTYQFFLFKNPIARTYKSEELKLNVFIHNSDSQGTDLSELMKDAASELLKVGQIFTVVDSSSVKPVTKADELVNDIVPYIYFIKLEDVLDYSKDDFGRLLWIKYKRKRDIKSSWDYRATGEALEYVIWSSSRYLVYNSFGELITDEINELGEVPIIHSKFLEGDSFVRDIVLVNKSIYNWCSLLDEILYKQTFSQLVMPQDPLQTLKDKNVGSSSAFTYDPNAKHPPSFIAPDVSQAKIFIEWIEKARNFIYALANLDYSGSLPNTSGIAKAYDFQSVSKILSALADTLQQLEVKIFKFYSMYTKGEASNDEDKEIISIRYPKEFSIMALLDRLDNLLSALSEGISLKYNELLKKQVVELTLPILTLADKKLIFSEIEKATTDDDLLMRMNKKKGVDNESENAIVKQQEKVVQDKLKQP